MTNTPTNPLPDTTVDIAKPPEESFSTLSAAEVQSLRVIMQTNREGRSKTFRVPEMLITEHDKDLFAESLCSGIPFKEVIERYKGKLKVTLRTKVKWEEDMIIEQIRKDFEDEYTHTDGQYVNRLNVYNLCFELCELDGVPQKPITKGTDLRKYVEDSVLESMLEPKLYILITLMAQFDDKVSRLCRLATPDFSKSDADS